MASAYKRSRYDAAMRIAFFGGTFDPPHRGHIAVAREAMTRLELDEVVMAPVATQPLKVGTGHSSFDQRFAMVRLAVANQPGITASNIDAPRPDGSPNYTLDTLQRMRSQLQPQDRLFCLLGADSFLTVKRWHRCDELLLFCDFIVAARPGFALDQLTQALPDGFSTGGEHVEPGYTRLTLSSASGQSSHLFLLPDLHQDISATEIRADLADGATERALVPPAVEDYIRVHGLYRYHKD
jgi:nicotinate-nucleotide adenylyltransferase